MLRTENTVKGNKNENVLKKATHEEMRGFGLHSCTQFYFNFTRCYVTCA